VPNAERRVEGAGARSRDRAPHVSAGAVGLVVTLLKQLHDPVAQVKRRLSQGRAGRRMLRRLVNQVDQLR